LAILRTVTLASMSNAPPDDGVTAPKYVGDVLMSILMLILKLFLWRFTLHQLVNKKKKILIISRCTVRVWEKKIKRGIKAAMVGFQG
jgi:hypothetical protein